MENQRDCGRWAEGGLPVRLGWHLLIVLLWFASLSPPAPASRARSPVVGMRTGARLTDDVWCCFSGLRVMSCVLRCAPVFGQVGRDVFFLCTFCCVFLTCVCLCFDVRAVFWVGWHYCIGSSCRGRVRTRTTAKVPIPCFLLSRRETLEPENRVSLAKACILPRREQARGDGFVC